MTWFVVSNIQRLWLLLLVLSPHNTQSYEYGYHPSAEEFDTFVRESTRTWTRDLLANERRVAGSPRAFVPKYNYERVPPGRERDKFAHPHTDRYDQQTEATELLGTPLASMLDFTMFSGEEQQHTLQVPLQQEHGQPVDSNKQKISSANVVFNLDAPPAMPGESHGTSDVTNFPIFFTNPVTGIVYAITEVGQMPQNHTKPHSNDTAIPIYITKQQYDRDMALQKQYYENKCQRPTYVDYMPATTITSVLSHSTNTTDRPQIIRLKKPPTNALAVKMPAGKQPTVHGVHPPPVMVQTGLVVNDRVSMPIRQPNRTKTSVIVNNNNNNNKTKKKKKKKSKNRNPKRPGRKSTTAKPLMAPTANKPPPSTFPYFVRGTVKPSPGNDRLSTQLEKPNLTTTTTFNERTGQYLTPLSRRAHVVRKRSAEPAEAATNLRSSPNGGGSKRKVNQRYRINAANGTGIGQRRKSGGSPLVIARILRRNHSTIASNSSSFKVANTTLATLTLTPPTVETANLRLNSTLRSTHKQLAKNGHKKKPANKKDNDGSSILDWFTYEDDDGDYADDDDYYYGDDDKEEGSSSSAKPSPLAVLKEPVVPDDSSAEEGIDIGALEDDETEVSTAQAVSSSTEENQSSSSKNAVIKKRIRRRPSGELSSTSYEDYDDDDDDDGGGGGDGGGVGSILGGFFRMVFHPVQMLMSGVMDSFADGHNSASANSVDGTQPMYTQYNSVHDDDESDVDKPNSFTGWFSSLFGLNRRTKKIGSKPKPTKPTPSHEEEEDDDEEEETGWLNSWLGYGKSTTEATSHEDNNDKWFFGWFDTSKPKQQRRRTTTTATTTTTISPILPQMPILTIVDPLRNPQNWIGILAHHIINSTSTHNPLSEMVSRFTTPVTPAPAPYIDNSGAPRKVYYDNYQIWRLKPQNDADLQALEELKKSADGLKIRWLRGPSLRGLTDVLVPPKMLIDFQGSLQFEGIDYEVLIFDVGKAIAYEKSKESLVYAQTATTKKPKHKNAPFTMSWHKYHTFDDIIKYLETIRMRQPQIVELLHIGRSYEGRPLVVVKIESKEKAAAANAHAGHMKLGQRKNSYQGNAVFIDSGSHGNEWIGPATTTWMINEVLRTMKSNKTGNDSDFIRNTTWYFMPVLNPDGYAYSHEFDRFWKKSRSRNIYRPDDFISTAMTWLQQKKPAERVCYGVDLQRNWNYQWGKRGTSKTPCNEFYAGPLPFSEPETKALSDFLMENRKQIQLYISMQSYGQIISYPTKANASLHSERTEDFHDVAMVGIDGLRKKGSKSRYKVDAGHDLLDGRSGSADAFAAFEVGIPFSYTMQLADNGVHGYLLPSSSIEPTARDVFDIVGAMLDYI